MPAWNNLAAAEIRACRRRAALFAARVALALDPALSESSTNLATAYALECPLSAGEDDAIGRAEWGAYVAQGSAAPWETAAAARRAAGDTALAVLYEELALADGAPGTAVRPRLAADLERLGLLDAAAATWDGAGSPEAAAAAARVRARAAALEPLARALGSASAQRAGYGRAEDVESAVALARVTLALAGGDPAADAALRSRLAADLDRQLGVGRPQRVAGWWGALELPARWRTVHAPPGPGAPELVLRRFPWDTQIALFAWAPVDVDLAAALLRRLADVNAALAGEVVDESGPAGLARRRVPLEIDAGIEGRARVDAWLVGPAQAAPRLLAIVHTGTGGAGRAGRAEAATEALALLRALEPAEGPAPVDAQARLALPRPPAWVADRLHDESADPWRRTALGGGLVVDLPPGVVGATVQPPAPDPQAGPATRLLSRGAFVDLEGQRVALGDARVFGVIDVPGGDAEALLADRAPPRADPEAQFVRRADLGPALALAGSDARGSVLRFTGRAFAGTWLVARLALGGVGVEIALPVAEGAGSPSVPWIALTAREESGAGPPPPADLSARFAVRWVRPVQRPGPADPRDGFVDTGTLQLPVPRGFRVSLDTASADGFPVTLREAEGTVAVLDRVTPGAPDLLRRDAEARLGAAPRRAWADVSAPRGARVAQALFAADGARRETWVLLVAPADGTGSGYRLTLQRGASTDETTWTAWQRLLSRSLRYRE